jgi:alpha-galactosidase
MIQVIAARLRTPLDTAGLPEDLGWADTAPVTFCSDWQARNPDSERLTQVQLLWSPDDIFLRFCCRYRDTFTYAGPPARRDRLWMRDVAEVFIRPESWEPNHYLEFEISPNGDWLDLDISPGHKSILCCNMKSRVVVDREHHTWTAEMAIPTNCFAQSFDPGRAWRLNFFRIEGRDPNRFYSAWIPTHTPQPNFHIPEVFGLLRFEE